MKSLRTVALQFYNEKNVDNLKIRAPVRTEVTGQSAIQKSGKVDAFRDSDLDMCGKREQDLFLLTWIRIYWNYKLFETFK